MIRLRLNLFEKWLQKHRYKKVKPFVKGRVLDFGCGDTPPSLLVKDIGEYTGVDKYNYHLIQGMYETIVMCAVLEHLTEPKKILRMLRGHLKKDGLLLITTPSMESKLLQELFVKLHIFHKENIEGHNYYRKNDLLYLAKEVDLKIVKYSRFQLGMNQLVVMKR